MLTPNHRMRLNRPGQHESTHRWQNHRFVSEGGARPGSLKPTWQQLMGCLPNESIVATLKPEGVDRKGQGNKDEDIDEEGLHGRGPPQSNRSPANPQYHGPLGCTDLIAGLSRKVFIANWAYGVRSLRIPVTSCCPTMRSDPSVTTKASAGISRTIKNSARHQPPAISRSAPS